MIKVNELRIGSIVGLKGQDTFYTVYMVEESGSIYFKELPEFHYDLEDDPVVGVPLTAEWLIKLGFEWIFEPNYDCGIRLGRYALAVDSDKKLLLIADGKATNQRAKGIGDILVEHVHKLQNLVFALTGEQLSIKEPA